MSDPFYFEQVGTKTNRRRKYAKVHSRSQDTSDNQLKTVHEYEEIPEVEQRNSSSHENMFDCFAPQANLIPIHEQSIVDSIADNSQYHKPFTHVEYSYEVELADDKTAVRSEEESFTAQQMLPQENVPQEYHACLYLTADTEKVDINQQLKELQANYETLQLEMNTKQDYYNESVYDLAFTRRQLAELEIKCNSLLNQYAASAEINQRAHDLVQELYTVQKHNVYLYERLHANGALAAELQARHDELANEKQQAMNYLESLEQENDNLKTQLEQVEGQLHQLENTMVSPISQIQQIMRPERQARHTEFFDDSPELFPLHFGSNPQYILYFLDYQIISERYEQINLPTFRQLLYSAVRYRLIQTCQELSYMRDSYIQELLLYDFNDVKLQGSFVCDLMPLNEIKMRLAVGQFEQAAYLAEYSGFFGVAQLIYPNRQVDFENVYKNMPEEAGEFMQLLRTLLSEEQQTDISDTSNIFHALGLTISLRAKLGFSEFRFRVLQFLRHNIPVYLKQVILIIAGVPCFYSAPFDFSYIKAGKSRLKESHFQQFLTKISKEFAVPSLEDFRLTEIYEFTFAKQNLSAIKPRITPQMINFQQFNDDLSEDNLVCEKSASASDVLSYMAFFPHILPMKAAFSGISRKAAQVNKAIAKYALFYCEIVIRNIKALLQYRYQNGVENYNMSDDNFDEFSVYEAAVLPLKVTEQAVRHPQVGASMQIWTNLGRYTSKFKSELRYLTKSSIDGMFYGDVELVNLFYGKEIEIPYVTDEIEENEDFAGEKSNEVSGLEINEQQAEESGNLEINENSSCGSEGFQPGSHRISPVQTFYQAQPYGPPKIGSNGGAQEAYRQPALAPFVVQEEVHEVDVVRMQPNPYPAPPQAEAYVAEQSLPQEKVAQVYYAPIFIASHGADDGLFANFESHKIERTSQSNSYSQRPCDTQASHSTKEQSNPFLEPPVPRESQPTPQTNSKLPASDVIPADTGKKLSRKWSTKLKRWVQVDENGNEVAPEKPTVEPPPPVVPLNDPFAVNYSQSTGEIKRRGTGRYKSSQ